MKIQKLKICKSYKLANSNQHKTTKKLKVVKDSKVKLVLTKVVKPVKRHKEVSVVKLDRPSHAEPMLFKFKRRYDPDFVQERVKLGSQVAFDLMQHGTVEVIENGQYLVLDSDGEERWVSAARINNVF